MKNQRGPFLWELVIAAIQKSLLKFLPQAIFEFSKIIAI